MPIPLGILAVAGAGGAAGAYDLLETTVLTTTAASVSFSSLGSYSDYKHLQLRITHRSNHTSANSYALTLNGATSGYGQHRLVGDGSTVDSAGFADQASIPCGLTFHTAGTANAFGATVIDILDFGSANKNKTVRILNGKAESSWEIALRSGFRNNTEAVTSIALATSSGSFIAGSRFSLYGVK